MVLNKRAVSMSDGSAVLDDVVSGRFSGPVKAVLIFDSHSRYTVQLNNRAPTMDFDIEEAGIG